MAADLAYALVQVAHNVGAVAVVGSPAAAWLWLREQRSVPTLLTWLVLSGWLTQIISGVSFGLTSYLSRGELPEVTGIALHALYLKITCASIGSTLAVVLLVSQSHRSPTANLIWKFLLALGLLALCGAAFLRWYG